MADKALYVAFLWHMHQPYYKDPFTGVYRLPWVRLHGSKDYLDMAQILEEFPSIRQTFNVVPSLLEQVIDYTDNGAEDVYLQASRKNPADMSEEERLFVIENFFLANWDNMIKPYPKYYELLTRRGFRFTRKDMVRVLRYFSAGDIRDLQVLFNLTWIDPHFRKNDPFLAGLDLRGKDFTEEEKSLLLDKQIAILKEIIPEYRKLASGNQIELSVTPFYHPILPLVCNTDAALMAMPHAALPRKRFSYPEDAAAQIRLGIEFFEKIFGYRPAGMWPSEGSVSEEVMHTMKAAGIRWTATDEEVLARSLGRSLRSHEGYLADPATLYKPHSYDGVPIFFRDHKLSDLIGFVYSGWHPDNAAADFCDKLVQIRASLPDNRPYVVPVILDGENAWEYYRNDGRDFLCSLYRRLSDDSRLRTVTFSEFLSIDGWADPLPRLHAGSWIGGNFRIWIGHEEDNVAWDYLAQTREDLRKHETESPGKDNSAAWKALYAAEGSDWNWWYGDDHATETQKDFDELFRSYLMKVYTSMGKEIPQFLYVPVLLEDRNVTPVTQARGFISPRVDGIVTSYFEWYQSAMVDVKRSGGSMHRSDSLISTVYFGFSSSSLFIRVDPSVPFRDIRDDLRIHLTVLSPRLYRIVFDLHHQENTALFTKENDQWLRISGQCIAAATDILEIEIPFADIMAQENTDIHFYLDVFKQNGNTGVFSGGNAIERCPWRGYITLTVPSPDYEKMMWY